MNRDIQTFNNNKSGQEKQICNLFAEVLGKGLPEAQSKIWHGSPVWFIDGNPVAGYSVLKDCVQLLFWSVQSFDEPKLQAEGSFKAAQAKYTNVDQIDLVALKRWIKKSKDIQWDYKNIVKRSGKLVRLK